ncbi:MAG: twitching motility protein PilT [Blautia sp.]
MVQLIVGEKGKGKTKVLLDKANAGVKAANGSVAYLDKSTKHMYELNNKIRLINVTEYEIQNCHEFVGFIRGILSQDNDLEQLYLDSFLRISKLEEEEEKIADVLLELEKLGKNFGLSFIISLSKNESDLPEEVKGMIETSL